jgi:hypothetical protein
VVLPIDKNINIWYYISVPKGNTPHRVRQGNLRDFKRNFKKGVDKPSKVWYNKDVPKGNKKKS